MLMPTIRQCDDQLAHRVLPGVLGWLGQSDSPLTKLFPWKDAVEQVLALPGSMHRTDAHDYKLFMILVYAYIDAEYAKTLLAGESERKAATFLVELTRCIATWRMGWSFRFTSYPWQREEHEEEKKEEEEEEEEDEEEVEPEIDRRLHMNTVAGSEFLIGRLVEYLALVFLAL